MKHQCSKRIDGLPAPMLQNAELNQEQMPTYHVCSIIIMMSRDFKSLMHE